MIDINFFKENISKKIGNGQVLMKGLPEKGIVSCVHIDEYFNQSEAVRFSDFIADVMKAKYIKIIVKRFENPLANEIGNEVWKIRVIDESPVIETPDGTIFNLIEMVEEKVKELM